MSLRNKNYILNSVDIMCRIEYAKERTIFKGQYQESQETQMADITSTGEIKESINYQPYLGNDQLIWYIRIYIHFLQNEIQNQQNESEEAKKK